MNVIQRTKVVLKATHMQAKTKTSVHSDNKTVIITN